MSRRSSIRRPASPTGTRTSRTRSTSTEFCWTAQSITPTNNENFGQTNDPYINKQITKLGAVPTTQLSTVERQWQSLDKYIAKNAYAAVFGYQTFPFFTSSTDQGELHELIYGWDLLGISSSKVNHS